MSTRLVLLAAAALLLGAAAPILHSSRITLPDEPIVPAADPDAQLVQANCIACHSETMIAYQPRLDEAHWAAEVEKMRSVYKAPVSDEDATRLPAILARRQAR